jgi:hypothetical protein
MKDKIETRGRKQKYGESTVTVRFRVPESKKEFIDFIVKRELKKWLTKKSVASTK